jgi:phosphomannomutase
MPQEKPDLGVCFDGDADRCMFLDETGQVIGCDIITALLARDFLQMPENKGSTIVYDLRSSHVVADEVKAAGGVPRRDRVGHAFIKKTMADTKAVFGGELSGHFYFRDNFFADSGPSPSRDCCRSFRPSRKSAQPAHRAAASATARPAK